MEFFGIGLYLIIGGLLFLLTVQFIRSQSDDRNVQNYDLQRVPKLRWVLILFVWALYLPYIAWKFMDEYHRARHAFTRVPPSVILFTILTQD